MPASHRRRSWTGLLLAVLLALLVLVLAGVFWRLNQPPAPDPKLVALSVRATVYALPTPTPQVIEVTRIVEVTRVFVATPTPAPALTATPTLTPTATPQAAAPPPARAAEAPSTPAPPTPAPPAPAAGAAAASGDIQAAAAAPAAAQPAAAQDAAGCPTTSDNQYATAPIDGGHLDHPDAQHADLNLTLRGWAPVDAPRQLVSENGPVDGDPPQLAAVLPGGRAPVFGQTYQVYDWNWGCGENGCRGALLTDYAVTLVELQTNPGEILSLPRRNAQVYAGGLTAIVLYAEPTQITLTYTRQDTVAGGYTVHLANLCVDPNLVALYRSSSAAGRGALPALHNGDPVGIAAGGGVRVAIRDRGVFLDPRSRLNWWQGY